MKSLVVLGAGTGGTGVANLLRKRLRRAGWDITIIDRDNEHYCQPGFLFIPFGFTKREDLVGPRSKFLPPDLEFVKMISDAGCRLDACKATVDMFKLKKMDLKFDFFSGNILGGLLPGFP